MILDQDEAGKKKLSSAAEAGGEEVLYVGAKAPIS
jgi:hypothetical protein